MSDLDIVVLAGNPRKGSRTRAAAEQFAATLTPSAVIVYLAELGQQLFDPHASPVRDTLDLAAQADVVVVATPVFKAGFTGLLKLFLDLLQGGGLTNVIALPVTVSASPTHKSAAEWSLRHVPVIAATVGAFRATTVRDSNPAEVAG